MPEQPIISVNNLTKNYGPHLAVKEVSFNVNKQQFFAFLGPNGAGKTTTIKMLTTLLVPTGGSMLIDGKDPAKDPLAVRQRFGIVFQDQSLDDELTAFENLDFHGILYGVPKEIRHERIAALLKVVELEDRKTDFVKHFSGGMKRRLEIARALLHHPAILFLDEPTVGLDPQTRNHIWDYIKRLNKDEHITVFFTTHYMEEAEKMADYVAIIDHGQIIAQGSPEELKKKTKTKTLEESFLKLTGKTMRSEEGGSVDWMRMHRKLWK